MSSEFPPVDPIQLRLIDNDYLFLHEVRDGYHVEWSPSYESEFPSFSLP